MLQVLRFLLNTVIDFMKMLFTVDVGDGLNLGLVMCIVFIFFPMILRVVLFLKRDALEELNDRYDESRPREVFSDTYTRPVKFRDGSVTYTHSITRRRRMR